MVLLKVATYYVVLLGAAWLLRDSLPVLQPAFVSFNPAAPDATAAASPGATETALATGYAMLAAALLSLPVAWIYRLTRAKRGYQQSVVQLLIILPLVVAGVVVLVKNSLALAFSLAGIVAAVRFRNTLDDSKDAVYVFLATAIGLACGVNVAVAVVISVMFNVAIVLLWATDFGHSPVALEGKSADKRLKRAREMSRTGTFVARMDDEVFRNMTREQLEGVAQRAWKRASESESGGDAKTELRLRVVTNDPANARPAIERQLGTHAKRWEFSGQKSAGDGVESVDYMVQLRRSAQPDDLIALIRTNGVPGLVNVELD